MGRRTASSFPPQPSIISFQGANWQTLKFAIYFYTTRETGKTERSMEKNLNSFHPDLKVGFPVGLNAWEIPALRSASELSRFQGNPPIHSH
jgi:hypothetical protein